MSRKMKLTVAVMVAAVSVLAAVITSCIPRVDTTSSQEPGLGVVEEAWDIILTEYVDRDNLDIDKLREGAIKGMMEALDDPYSSYMNTETYKLSISSIQGSFEGIGAYVGVREGNITVIAPITGSPAERAGIKAGDIILAVEGDSTADMTLNEVVLRIRGPEGTTVTILVLHSGETETEEYTITRAEIELSSVYLEMKDDIAYIHISNFSERTNDELTPVIDAMEKNKAAGIILDLRSNPGGLLSSVVDVTSRFLEEGYVLHSRDNKGNQESYSVKHSGKTTSLPLVILTDNYTASASEVLSGALQDYDRAVVAGTVTYGKGSVNTLHNLEDGSGIYITTHRWLTPKGRLIEGKGITPDYEILEGDLVDWGLEYLHTEIKE